ncbi:MAG: hypothetical protein ACI85O_000875 [Saprospiraceae bacterium]|jgi:hypothetical protein
MLKKILLSIILLITHSLSAQMVLDKPVDFLVENEKISEALFSLSELADVNITFSPKFFEKNKKISIAEEDKPLKLVLRKCLAGTEIGFQFSDGGIVLFRKVAKKHTLSGYLSDEQTGERLVGANIFELSSSQGGASNAYGFYSQKFKQGKVKLQISYLGYQTEIVELDLNKSRSFNIALEPSLTLTEVVITARKDSVLITGAGQGTTLPLERLSHMPQAAGEADVMRYIQMLPGVQSGADGFGGLHVRGGNSDQNLILMDDVPVYNPSHTFGLFSIFNPDLAKSVKFFKSGFPARYDGRISSVLDVRTREGNNQRFSSELSVGMMATKGIVEIPLGRGKGGLLLAGRKTHINSWLIPLSKKTKAEAGLVGEMNYQFADFNAKAHYNLGQKDKVYLSYYVGQDNFLDTEEVEAVDNTIEGGEFPIPGFATTETRNYKTDWGNSISSLRWNHLFNDKLFSNTTLTFSNFTYVSDIESEVDVSLGEFSFAAFQESSHYGSHISDMSFRTDFDYFLNEIHHLRFGLNATNRKFIPGFSETRFRGANGEDFPIEFEADITIAPIIRTNEFNFYVEEEYQRNNWALNVGLHLSAFISSERKDFIPQPRMSVTYSFSDRLKINTALARTTQFLHLITKTDSGLPEDLWVPVGAKTPPPSAWQISLGASGILGTKSSWRTEFYAKTMQNVLQIKQEAFQSEGDSFVLEIDATNWEGFVEKGSGESYGVETTFEQQRGKLTGWLSYSFAVSNRTFKGEKTAYNFDSRHGITAAATYQLNKVIDFSMSWLYQSGRPMLESSNFDNSNVPFSSILGENTIPKSDRLPAYHRLDAGINLHFNRKRLKHKIHLGVYNAYNRKNVFFTYPTTQDDQVGVVNSLPILPSFSYGIKF